MASIRRTSLWAHEGYRLFDQREEDVRANKEWLLDTLQYPLAAR